MTDGLNREGWEPDTKDETEEPPELGIGSIAQGGGREVVFWNGTAQRWQFSGGRDVAPVYLSSLRIHGTRRIRSATPVSTDSAWLPESRRDALALALEVTSLRTTVAMIRDLCMDGSSRWDDVACEDILRAIDPDDPVLAVDEMRTRSATPVGPNERPPFGCCLLIWSTEWRDKEMDR